MSFDLTEREKNELFTTGLVLNTKTAGDVIKEIFKSLLSQVQKNYDSDTEQTAIIIPLIGTLYLKYNGECTVVDPVTKNDKRDLNILVSFIPSRSVKQAMSDLVDGNDTDVEKEMYKKIGSILEPNFRKE